LSTILGRIAHNVILMHLPIIQKITKQIFRGFIVSSETEFIFISLGCKFFLTTHKALQLHPYVFPKFYQAIFLKFLYRSLSACAKSKGIVQARGIGHDGPQTVGV
jgi:hypothetical protein